MRGVASLLLGTSLSAYKASESLAEVRRGLDEIGATEEEQSFVLGAAETLLNLRDRSIPVE